MSIEVQIRQPSRDCPLYTWDRERGQMRLTGIDRAEAGLPADLAIYQLEGEVDVPVFLLSTYSSPQETLVQARLLGALRSLSSGQTIETENILPMNGWVFVAVAEVDEALSTYHSPEVLPTEQRVAMAAYVRKLEEGDETKEEIAWCDADAAAQLLRETRLFLKRKKRNQPKGKSWFKREEEERPVGWRAIEGLSETLRLQVRQGTFLQGDATAPYAQAEYLIRLVPQRFQKALADLLLDDERLLAFVERPLLRHRVGWLGMQTWRSNAGVLLVTDRQVLWVRDFLSPGTNFLSGGYIAHSAPLERLQSISIIPPERIPDELRGRLEPKDSPYLRLVMEVASSTGNEMFVVEFPKEAEVEKALAEIVALLRAFLPAGEGREERRLRRLPWVEAWVPRGTEAEQLAGLGGIVPATLAERLKQQLARLVQRAGEELLVSALVPALEDYQSPARLIALTRHALIVIEDAQPTSRRWSRSLLSNQAEEVHQYEMTVISSAQLRYSLLGSSLSIFVPQADGETHQHVFPFHSPAIAWFLPLFTRLRLLLSGPYRTS